MNEKPKSISKYKEWLRDEHSFEINDRTSTHYESVVNKMQKAVENSECWKRIQINLPTFNQAYLLKTGYHLLPPKFELELVTKSFDSFLSKTYRKNILNNRNWPNEPYGGWLLPDSWFFKVNDIVRTLFIVKYLDGVEYLTSECEKVREDLDQEFRVYMEAREEGYYAAHFYTKIKTEIPKENWDTEAIEFQLEFQITTQLQEVIRKLLHSHYEDRRSRQYQPKEKWQWDYKSDEFSTNYLGHILHYVEGMIMDVREKKNV